MQNFDVQLNLLLANKALLVVLTVCLALSQRCETISLVFNIMCSFWIKRWKKLLTR